MYKQYSVSFTNAGKRLFGVLLTPSKQKPRKHPCVVLAHGFTGEKTEHHKIFVLCARLLAENGIASLRFDFRFSGDSEGNFENTTISSQISDFKEALRYVSRRNRIDKKRIGTLGLSMGSVVAFEASLGSELVKAVCLWATIADPAKVFGAWLEKGWFKFMEDGRYGVYYGLPPDYSQPGWILKKDFFTDLPKHNLLSAVKNLKKPLLIIHGKADQDVDVNNSIELYQNAYEPKKLKLIEDGGHVFFGNHQTEEALGETVKFFKEAL
jgi:fermentation-respiration switch protein FrsA (DUF1100 family)